MQSTAATAVTFFSVADEDRTSFCSTTSGLQRNSSKFWGGGLPFSHHCVKSATKTNKGEWVVEKERNCWIRVQAEGEGGRAGGREGSYHCQRGLSHREEGGLSTLRSALSC